MAFYGYLVSSSLGRSNLDIALGTVTGREMSEAATDAHTVSGTNLTAVPK